MAHTNISITTGTTPETILAANAKRTAATIVAVTETGFLKFGGTAGAGDGLAIPVNTVVQLNIHDHPGIGGAWSYYSATTGAVISIYDNV